MTLNPRIIRIEKIFETKKEILEHKIDQLENFKASKQDENIKSQLRKQIERVVKRKNEVIETITNYYDKILNDLNKDLNELDTVVSSISIDLIKSKADSLTDDTFDQAKKFKSNDENNIDHSQKDKFYQFLLRRNKLIGEFVDSFDLTYIYEQKIDSLNSVLNRTDYEMNKFLQNLKSTNWKEVNSIDQFDNKDLLILTNNAIIISDFQKTKKIIETHDQKITCIKIINAELFVTGCSKGILKFWDAKTYVIKDVINAHISKINSICFNDTFIFTASNDGFVKRWKIVKTGNTKAVYQLHSDSVKCVLVYKYEDKEMLISGSSDRTLCLYDLQKNELERVFYHDSIVNCVEKMESKKLLFTGSCDKIIKVWDMCKYECIRTIKCDGFVQNLKLFNDELLFSHHSNGVMNLWSIDNGECVHSNDECLKNASCSFITKDGKLVIGNFDKKVQAYCFKFLFK